MIGLEATTIDVQSGAVLAANGGGGGGGANGGGAEDGDDAPLDGTQAFGGVGETNRGSDGGNGSFMGALNGVTAAPSPDRGGGGGGGSAGYILYYQDTTPNLSATIISPAAMAGP